MNPTPPSTQTASLLSVCNVSKRYAKYKSVFSRLLSWIGLPSQASYEYWANKNISFEVKPGQAIAIIGQNGAGKSTLLKMITGTVRPTSGQIHMRGRISAMLELGLGFNPEFTGKENAYMAGGLLGFSQTQLDELMPAIEAFAEIGEFFHQPLRVYSSGMQARLAFAVATAVRPDVLIVDEILSVGDSYFQHRSFDRIKQFKEQGTSIILVTHGMGDVRALCDHVILLDKGSIAKQGAADEVVDYYNAMIAQKENTNHVIQQNRNEKGWLVTQSGDGRAHLHELTLRDSENKVIEVAQVGQAVHLHCVIQVNANLEDLVLGLMLRDRQGSIIWGSNTWHTKQVLKDIPSGKTIVIDIPFTCTLGQGSYSVTAALTRDETHLNENYEWSDNVLVFDVLNVDKTQFIGNQWLNAQFQMKDGTHED